MWLKWLSNRPRSHIRSRLTAGLLIFLFSYSACIFQGEETWFKEADIFIEKGQFQEAVQAYQKYLDKYPEGSFRDKALFSKGNLYYNTLNLKSLAVIDFSMLAEQHPDSPYCFRAREILARIYRYETNDYMNAIIEYHWLLGQSKDPDKKAEFQYIIAHCYFLDNKFDRSIIALNDLIALYPDSAFAEQAYDELGSAYMILNQPDQALEIFEKMNQLFPDSSLKASIDFKIGECYERMGRLNDALRQYLTVREYYKNPSAVDIRIRGVRDRLARRQP